MDPLSQAIALLKPRALSWRVVEAHDPWTIRFPTTDVVIFGQLIEGSCEVELAGGTTMTLRAGDFLLMAAPDAWTMRSAGDAAPVAFTDLMAEPGLLLSNVRDPTVTRFIAGAFVFAAPNAGLLTNLMAPLIHVRGTDVAAGRLGTLLKLLGDEALGGRPGRSLVLDRLLEIVLVESLRHRPVDRTVGRPGLLAGLEDARVGAALAIMHVDARRPWTVATLAAQVGMSRSSFAALFTATVGASPMAYLLDWRMSLAKEALTSSKKPMSEIALLAGYRSVSAFSTAFRDATGRSPTRYLRDPAPTPRFDPPVEIKPILQGGD